MNTDSREKLGKNDFPPVLSEKNINATQIPFSFAIYDELLGISRDNIQYFEKDRNSETSKRFVIAFLGIIKQMEIVRECVAEFFEIMHEYDFENVPANGYRSLVKAMHGCINDTLKLSKHIAANRTKLLFRKMVHLKHIESYSQALVSMCSVFEETNIVRAKCSHGTLFPTDEHHATNAEELFDMIANVEQRPFYGHCSGFHYCASMRWVMKLLNFFIVGFSEFFYSKHSNSFVKITSAIHRAGKYLRKPDFLAKRYLDVSMYSEVDFIQSVAAVGEYDLLHVPHNWLSAKVKVNQMITIAPEPFEMENIYDPKRMVEIPIPTSHVGVGSVTVRLISNVYRNGMAMDPKKNHQIHPVSNGLIVHIHSGGFAVFTSKCHEVYLRDWASKLQVPIISIDYSLAPQAPYPRALEEIFYAYCWSIKNAHQLGTTAERIVLAGDSAGGTLTMALTLKCIEQGVRPPDGALPIYGPFNIGYDPSPSRMLASLDCLVSFGTLMKLLRAYVVSDNEQSSDGEKRNFDSAESSASSTESAKIRRVLSTNRNIPEDFYFHIPKDPFISPLYASDEMLEKLPPVKLVTADMDPFVDDNVTMAKRLRALGKSVELDVISGLPHGFLNFLHISRDAYDGNCLCVSRLAELLGITLDAK